MTLPDGCVGNVSVDGRPSLHRVWIAPREAVATIGAGDAFLAGYVAARYEGSAPGECLRYGVACGAESTQRLGAGVVDPQGVGRLLSEVDVERARRSPPRPSERRSSRRPRRPREGRACYSRDVAAAARHASPHLLLDPACAGSFRPPPSLGSPNGA